MNILGIKRKSQIVSTRSSKKRQVENETLPTNDEDAENDEDELANPLATLLKERERVDIEDNNIYFRTDVSEKSVGKLVKLINKINKEYLALSAALRLGRLEPEPIFLHITSEGGDLAMGFLAADVVKNSKVPIYTIVEGYCISAATLISVCGHKRYITENSLMLIHQLSAVQGGTYNNLRDHSSNNDLCMRQLKNIYLNNTDGKMKKTELEKLLCKDIFLDAKKCLEYGLSDDIYRGEHMVMPQSIEQT